MCLFHTGFQWLLYPLRWWQWIRIRVDLCSGGVSSGHAQWVCVSGGLGSIRAPTCLLGRPYSQCHWWMEPDHRERVKTRPAVSSVCFHLLYYSSLCLCLSPLSSGDVTISLKACWTTLTLLLLGSNYIIPKWKQSVKTEKVYVINSSWPHNRPV